MKIGSVYEFAAAHMLPKVPEGHKCGRMHGHNWTLEVELLGACTDKGWIMDSADLDTIVAREVVSVLDHQTLNNIDGLANPTSENVVIWIAARLKNALEQHIRERGGSSTQLVKVKVWENKRFYAEWGTRLG